MYKSAMYVQINAQPAICMPESVLLLLFYFMYMYFIWIKKESHGHSHGDSQSSHFTASTQRIHILFD